MGLFNFGNKKAPKELFEQAEELYNDGKISKALSIYRQLTLRGYTKAGYYAGKIYADKGNEVSPRVYLITAAENGHKEAARLLAERFGVKDYLSKDM